MYYPKQLPYLLNEEFQQAISYLEYSFEELKDYVMCIWSMKSKETVEKTIYNYILPDACIDIVINFTEKTICFAGFSKETIPYALSQEIDYIGVRLKPGAFYAIFQVDADQVMDHPIDFFLFETDRTLEKLFYFKEEQDRLALLREYLQSKLKKTFHQKYILLVDWLYEHPNDHKVLEIATWFGYDKRHLGRIFKKYYGISPKVLLNILRLHLCLTLLLSNEVSLYEIMNRCGFYDQAHFIKEIKRYTGFSPLELLTTYRD